MTNNDVMAPIHGPWDAARVWVEQHGLDPRLIRWSPVLSEQSFPPGEEELREYFLTGAWISWLGGPAAGPLPDWPRRTDGQALAHVATIDLADVDGVLDGQGKDTWEGLSEGLPVTGLLEVFHDLETYGYEPEDSKDGGWLVRWVADPDRSLLVSPPEDDPSPEPACQVVMSLPGWTLPSAMDAIGASDFESCETAETEIRASWVVQRTRKEGHPIPFSHVYGHSQTGEYIAREILEKALPLKDLDDGYVLLLDLESWTTLSGWFGDASQLEVWIRSSDLEASMFDDVWCIIRTD